MYLAIVSAKYANQPSDFNQLLHTDFPNHTLTVPRPETGYQQMETFIYLNDVDRDNGATRFVSRRLTHAVPVEEHTLNLDDYGDLYRRGRRRLGPGRVDRRLPPRRLPPLGRLRRSRSGPFHAPRLVQAGRGGMGRLSGLAVQGVLARVAQLRAARFTATAGRPRVPRARACVLDRGDPGRRGPPLPGVGPRPLGGSPTPTPVPSRGDGSSSPRPSTSRA